MFRGGKKILFFVYKQKEKEREMYLRVRVSKELFKEG